MTISTYRYEGYETPDCLFGGISLFDVNVTKTVFPDGVREHSTFCTNRPAEWTNLPNFYSGNNYALLTMHSYPHYSFLNVTLKVSVTLCLVVKVDPCGYFKRYRQLKVMQSGIQINMNDNKCLVVHMHKMVHYYSGLDHVYCGCSVFITKTNAHSIFRYSSKAYFSDKYRRYTTQSYLAIMGEGYNIEKPVTMHEWRDGEKNTLEETHHKIPVSVSGITSTHKEISRFYSKTIDLFTQQNVTASFTSFYGTRKQFSPLSIQLTLSSIVPTTDKSVVHAVLLIGHNSWFELTFGPFDNTERDNDTHLPIWWSYDVKSFTKIEHLFSNKVFMLWSVDKAAHNESLQVDILTKVNLQPLSVPFTIPGETKRNQSLKVVCRDICPPAMWWLLLCFWNSCCQTPALIVF